MRKHTKRLVAFLLATIMVLTGVPPVTSQAATEVTLDFGRPTAGVSLDGTMGGVSDSTAAGTYAVSTALSGENWRINPSLTDVPMTDSTMYQLHANSGAGTVGMSIQKWPSANFTALQLNKHAQVGFDFTVPEEGLYSVVVTYNNRTASQKASMSINGAAAQTIPEGTDSSNVYATIDLGTHMMSAGDYANTLVYAHAASTEATPFKKTSMIRSVTLTKVGGGTTPTPTAAPTLEPTAAPTATPTTSPTEAPTQAPAGSANIIDFAYVTAGLSLDGVLGGMDDSSAVGNRLVTTAFAGQGWRINPTLTTVPMTDATTYQLQATGGNGTPGMSVQRWTTGKFTALQVNMHETVGFDFTVSEAGLYTVKVTYNERNVSQAADLSINGSLVGNIPVGTASANGYKTIEVGTCVLSAGDYANTLTYTHAGPASGKGYRNTSMVRSIEFTRLGDAPTPTPAPTAAPTLAPTAAPTPMPTEDPNAVKEPFRVSVEDIDMSTVFDSEGVRFYFTPDTVGTNWSVHSDTSVKNLVTDGATYSARARVYLANNAPSYINLQNTGADLALAFTAPASGYYDLSTSVYWSEGGGYSDVYVNDQYVGTIDGNKDSDVNEQKLVGVYLNGGHMANKITIKGTGRSTGTKAYTNFRGYNFTVPQTVAKLTGVEIIAPTTSMIEGDTQTIVTNGAVTNGALYRLSSVGHSATYQSSNPSVVTVTNDGFVTAVGVGTATITATVAGMNAQDTIEITVGELTFAEAEINIEEGMKIVEGDTYELEPKARLTNNAYIDEDLFTVEYASSKNSVAKIENGVLKALKPGNATITTTITYNGIVKSVDKNIEVLEDFPEVPFNVDFATSKELIIDDEGVRFYFSKDTNGENWAVSNRTASNVLGTSNANRGVMRLFYADAAAYLKFMSSGIELVLDVEAPVAGYYDVAANMYRGDDGGYAAIYVNDVYIGTADSYLPEGETKLVATQPLLGVKLKAGKNTVTIKSAGKSQGAKSAVMIAGLAFTAPDMIATITGIDAVADVEEMYIGREEQIRVDTLLSNGGFYQIEHSEEIVKYESSDPTVATVSDSGLITGVGAGDVTITVTAENLGYTDTLTFDVSGAAYDKVEMNVEQGEAFYVMEERTLEVVATLADGTLIAPKDLTVTYSSNNESVAKVENGILKVVGKGTADITAEAIFRVGNVVQKDIKTITATTLPLKAVTVVPEKAVVQELDKDGVKLIVKGVTEDDRILDDLVLAGFTSFDYSFETLNPEILTVDADGTCHFVSRGTAQIKINAVIDGVPLEGIADVVAGSQKTGRTLYTDDMVANALYNTHNYKWGIKELNRIIGGAYEFVVFQEQLYDSIPSEGVPRSNSIASLNAPRSIENICPHCGVDVEMQYAGDWGMDLIREPWKIWCQNCQMRFPTNDFALLYKRGLDENGEYNVELAYQRNAEAVARGEKDALVNELYPELGPTWMVDDGFGWSPADGTYGTSDLNKYSPVAKYAHDFWYDGTRYHMQFILMRLRDVYLYTGDERFGRAGAILMDRIADVYPSFDITKVSLGYNLAHGGGYSGKTIGAIWENYLASMYAECYDAFYPMFSDPEVIAFLSRKSAELGLDNPKTSGNLILENVENGIMRTIIKGIYDADIYGNFGFQQNTATKAAVALDTQPETDQVLEWLCAPMVVAKETVVDPIYGTTRSSRCHNTGGEMELKYVNEIDRDGFGGEVSISYNSIWMERGVEIADILANYDTDILDLYGNPKFVKMFESFIKMTVGDGYSLALGDGGDASEADITDFSKFILRGYRSLRDPKLAQIYDYYVRGDYTKAYIDMYSDSRDLITSIQNDIKTHGPLVLESENLTGYGLAVVRGGKATTKTDQYETRYDTWMYYGRTAPSHAHFDMLQMGINAYGFDFTPDLGYPEVTGTSANRYEWIKASISHNLVVVDDRNQLGVYTGTPLHFDSTENVKIIDAESSESYEQTDIYRRSVVTIAANEDVSYTVDFFRVKGGNKHTYTFHTQSYRGYYTDDIDLVPQIDETGDFAGTYAGVDVPYGPDPNSTDNQYSKDPVHPTGYTWLTHVNRGTDKNGDGLFTVRFDQLDFKDQVLNSQDLRLKIHAVNDWTPDSIDFAIGYPPRKKTNIRVPGYDYMFIQRNGENLDTLFTTVIEPYRTNGYIFSAEGIVPTIKAGTEGADDVCKVVKVTHMNGRVDYVVYATNNGVTYTITDGNVSFDFAGFIGVYTVDKSGNNVYSYVNDGTVIGNQTSVGAYTGTVVDFTKTLEFENSILIKPDQTIDDLNILTKQYIYVDNEGAECTGAYRILSAEYQGENVLLHLGNASTIENYVDDYNLDAGYIYTIAEGQNFRIPVSVTEGGKFTGTNRPSGVDESKAEPQTTETPIEEVLEQIVVTDEATEVPSDKFEEPIGTEPPVVEPTEPSSGNEGGEGEPSPTPEATDANAGGKGVRNILLGGLGVLALSAGLFLILLGKKKEEDEEA